MKRRFKEQWSILSHSHSTRTRADTLSPGPPGAAVLYTASSSASQSSWPPSTSSPSQPPPSSGSSMTRVLMLRRARSWRWVRNYHESRNGNCVDYYKLVLWPLSISSESNQFLGTVTLSSSIPLQPSVSISHRYILHFDTEKQVWSLYCFSPYKIPGCQVKLLTKDLWLRRANIPINHRDGQEIPRHC